MEPFPLSLWLVPVLSLLYQFAYFLISRACFLSKCCIESIQLYDSVQIAYSHRLQGQVGLVVAFLLEVSLHQYLASHVGDEGVFHEANYLCVPVPSQRVVHPVHARKLVGRHIVALTQELAEVLFVRKVHESLRIDKAFALPSAELGVTAGCK